MQIAPPDSVGPRAQATVFPTIKTHVQAATAEEIAAYGTLGTARNLREHGWSRPIRELAHALMFSGYEQVMRLGGAQQPGAPSERVAVVGRTEHRCVFEVPSWFVWKVVKGGCHFSYQFRASRRGEGGISHRF